MEDRCGHPQPPSRKDFSDWEVWSVESLQLSALLGSPAAESHFAEGSLYLVSEWDQVKLPGHFSSVRDRHWQIILAPPFSPILAPGPLQVGGCFARPAEQFDFLYPILLPPSSFHRYLSLINILHPKLCLSLCFWRTQCNGGCLGLDRGIGSLAQRPWPGTSDALTLKSRCQEETLAHTTATSGPHRRANLGLYSFQSASQKFQPLPTGHFRALC